MKIRSVRLFFRRFKRSRENKVTLYKDYGKKCRNFVKKELET